MKIRIVFVVSLLFALSISGIAQSKVTIAAEKVTYKRSSANAPDRVRTLTVTYPKISGIGDYEREAKIEKAISYWVNFDNTLSDEIDNDYRPETSYGYTVNFNDKGILDIQLTHTVYVFDFVKTIVVDLESGDRIKLADAFQNRKALFDKIAQAHKKEMDAAVATASTENFEYSEASMLENTKQNRSIYEIEEFSVSDKGVTFIFKYAVEPTRPVTPPAGRYFFTWEELRPHVAEYGVLSKFLNPAEQD